MVKKYEDAINVKLIALTQPVIDNIPDAEGLISYQARVSNPSNQENFNTAKGLLNYCARNGHWSVFEMCNAVIEIETTRDISRQILRHSSARFQEFSQRYAEVDTGMFCYREARFQDQKNRQNSIEIDVSDSQQVEVALEWAEKQHEVLGKCEEVYRWALDNEIAKEQARSVLPEGLTMSRMYMNGTVRTWMHYCKVRGGDGTQKEHILVEELIAKELIKHFPSLEDYFV